MKKLQLQIYHQNIQSEDVLQNRKTVSFQYFIALLCNCQILVKVSSLAQPSTYVFLSIQLYNTSLIVCVMTVAFESCCSALLVVYR